MTGRPVVTGLVLVALVGAAGGLHAQARDTTSAEKRRMMGMMEMMQGCPMMGGMAQGPDAALTYAKELGLTDAQRARLKELKRAAEGVLTPEQRAKLSELVARRSMQSMMSMMEMMQMMADSGMGDMGMMRDHCGLKGEK